MFSGIIASIGKIERALETEGGLRLVIDSADLGLSDVSIGDSIAVDGVCLTVVEKESHVFHVDV